MIITDITGTATLNNGAQMPYLSLGVYKARDGQEVIKTVQDAC